MEIFFLACMFLLFYIYAGYPLLLGILARLVGKRQQFAGAEPTVTLLIAAYNEQSVIHGKLENSLNLDYPKDKLQILVAADGCSDTTVEIVEKFYLHGVDLCYSPERRGKMAAIHHAMQSARGEVVVFSDANNLYDRDTLRELVKPFAEKTVGAVSGAKHILKSSDGLSASEGLYWRYESWIKEMETQLGSCAGVSGEVLALRKSLYVPPKKEIINDDFYLASQVLRQGYRVVYAPEAKSYEYVSVNSSDEVVRRARIIAGRYLAMGMAGELLPWQSPLDVWKIVSHKFTRPLAPFAMLGLLFANLLLVFPMYAWHPRLSFYLGLLGLQTLFYFLAFIGSRFAFKGLAGKLLYLPTYLVNSNYAALAGFFRFLLYRQDVRWDRVARREEVQA